MRKTVSEALKYGGLDTPYGNSARRAINDVCATLQRVLKDPLLEQHRVPQDTENIVHYTSIGTLVSVLNRLISREDPSSIGGESQGGEIGNKEHVSLRLYDTFHSNDPDEGNYFYRKFKQHLAEEYGWVLKDDKSFHSAYVASFVLPEQNKNTEDDLVFWRGYGKEGEGCSLLIPINTKENMHFRSNLKKVIYEEDKVQVTMEKLQMGLEYLNPLIHAEDSGIKEYAREQLANAFWKLLSEIRYLYKSKAYEHENECRYVSLGEGGERVFFEYQDRRNDSPPRLRHYLEIEALQVKNLLGSNSVITLGPCVPYRSNVQFCLQALLRKAKVYARRVICSEIVYRKP